MLDVEVQSESRPGRTGPTGATIPASFDDISKYMCLALIPAQQNPSIGRFSFPTSNIHSASFGFRFQFSNKCLSSGAMSRNMNLKFLLSPTQPCSDRGEIGLAPRDYWSLYTGPKANWQGNWYFNIPREMSKYETPPNTKSVSLSGLQVGRDVSYLGI